MQLIDKLEEGKKMINKQQNEILKHKETIESKKLQEIRVGWYTEGLVKFSEIISKNKENIEKLSQKIISNLVDYLEVDQGGLFLLNDNNEDNLYLELVASFGHTKKKLNNNKFMIGEGLVGTCFAEGKIVEIDNVPDTYTSIKSGLGNSIPEYLILIPLKLDEIKIGVIELAAFKKLDSHKLELVNKISESVTSVISIIKANTKSLEAVKSAKIHSEELKSAEEELRQNLEELTAAHEELSLKQSALLAERAMFETLMNFLQDRITFKDVDSNYLRINKVKSDALNLDNPYDAVGKSDIDFFGKKHAVRAHADEKKLIESGKPILNAEEQIKFPDGNVRWGSTSRIPFKNAEGEMVGALIITRDISNRKILEGENSGKSSVLVEFAKIYPVIFYKCNHLGKLIDIFGKGLSILNFKVEEIKGKDIVEVFPELSNKLTKLETSLIYNYKKKIGNNIYKLQHLTFKNTSTGGIIGSAIIEI